jgi:hypothetical protein
VIARALASDGEGPRVTVRMIEKEPARRGERTKQKDSQREC